jgi:hypothetical protein
MNGRIVIHNYGFACMLQHTITDCKKEYNIDDLLAEGCTVVGHY